MGEIFAEDRHSLSMRLEDGKVENVVSGTDRGASIRLIQALSTAFGYVDSLDEGALVALADGLSRSQDGASTEVFRPGAPLARPRFWVDKDPSLVGAEEKAALLHLVDSTAREMSPEVHQVIAAYGENRQRVWIANSEGMAAIDDRTRVMIAVTVMTRRGDLIQTGRETLAHHGGFELFEGGRWPGWPSMPRGRPSPCWIPYRRPRGACRSYWRTGSAECCSTRRAGMGLRPTTSSRRRACGRARRASRWHPPDVFAYDDGVAVGMWGSSGCDDEGTPSERTTLVEAGVLTGYLSDRLRGGHLGLPLTGNGRRQDFRHIPYPRMTNTYFGPGKHSCDEIIADTPRALYAKSLSGGEVNPATGDFVFGVAEGYVVEKGRVGPAVRGATLIGNGPEVLRGIDAIADDLDVKAGMCGKEGQHVPVGSGQPTLRIRELTVGGTSLS